MLHLAPVACALTGRSDVDVKGYVPDGDQEMALSSILERLGCNIPLVPLRAPLWARWLSLLSSRWVALKLPRMLAALGYWRQLDVLVAAERTSTILRRLPGRVPLLIHIPHGAGDRAKGFEPRIGRFDHVIVAGQKDRERLIAERVLTPDRCSVSGYVKRAAVKAMAVSKPSPLFPNDRPIVLYNPHFSRTLSSWDRFAFNIVEEFASQTQFNLIVAPHVRLAERLTPQQRGAFMGFGNPDQILIDFGSDRSSDMTYSLAADLYLGDVSSQVYEFLDRPKSCVFLNAGSHIWQADPSFAHWRLGEVITDPADVLPAVQRAFYRHHEFADAQKLAMSAAMGDPDADADAVGNAAQIIVNLANGGDRNSGLESSIAS